MTQKTFLHRNTTHWLIFLVLLTLMLILQFSAVRMRSFWEDEAQTARLVHEPYPVISERLQNIHPPLYWWSVSLWSQVFGDTEAGLKSFSVVCLILVFMLTYKLASNLFSPRVGLIAVGLLTFSPLVLTYGHNARYYSMAAFLSLLVTIAAVQYVRMNKWYFLTIYILAGTSLLYTIYMGGSVLIALNLWWFIQWVKEKQKFSRIITWGLAQGMILLFYIPWLSKLFSASAQFMPKELITSNWLLQLAFRTGYVGYAFGVGEFFSPLNPVLWLGILLTIGLLIFAFINRTPNLWLLILILFVGITISIFFNLLGDYPQTDWQNLSYRLFFIYPFILVIVAFGINHLKNKWQWGALAAILIVYSVGIFNYFTNQEAIKPILIVPWREIFSNIQAQADADTSVVCTIEDTACFYYQTRYGFERTTPRNWESIAEQNPDEVWWVQSFRGDFGGYSAANINDDAQAFKSVSEQYTQADVFNYIPQDPDIDLLKSKFLGKEEYGYDYRVVVYRFVLP